MNVWNFTGNIGKDCEVATTQGGTTVCKFSVAVTSGYGDNKKTTWVNCRLWGKRAEGQLPQYLTKGQQVAVSGEAELAEWQGQDGTQNKALMVSVNNVDLCGSRDSAPQQAPQQQAPQNQGGYQQPQQQAPQQNYANPQAQANVPQGHGGYQNSNPPPQGMDFDEDIPF